MMKGKRKMTKRMYVFCSFSWEEEKEEWVQIPHCQRRGWETNILKRREKTRQVKKGRGVRKGEKAKESDPLALSSQLLSPQMWVR